jgi:hypothetical protein
VCISYDSSISLPEQNSKSSPDQLLYNAVLVFFLIYIYEKWCLHELLDGCEFLIVVPVACARGFWQIIVPNATKNISASKIMLEFPTQIIRSTYKYGY